MQERDRPFVPVKAQNKKRTDWDAMKVCLFETVGDIPGTGFSGACQCWQGPPFKKRSSAQGSTLKEELSPKVAISSHTVTFYQIAG
jgi:hypothetical protein